MNPTAKILVAVAVVVAKEVVTVVLGPGLASKARVVTVCERTVLLKTEVFLPAH